MKVLKETTFEYDIYSYSRECPGLQFRSHGIRVSSVSFIAFNSASFRAFRLHLKRTVQYTPFLRGRYYNPL